MLRIIGAIILLIGSQNLIAEGESINMYLYPQDDACVGQSLSIEVEAEFLGKGTTYQLYVDNNLFDEGTENAFFFQINSSADIFVKAIDGENSYYSDTVYKRIIPYPSPLSIDSLEMCRDSCIELSPSSDAAIFTWTPGTYLSQSSERIYSCCADQNITYELYMSDSSGKCIISSPLTVTVNNCHKAPTSTDQKDIQKEFIIKVVDNDLLIQSLTNQRFDVSVFDLNGQLLINASGVKSSYLKNSLNHFSAGLYLVYIQAGDREMRKKVFIQ